MKKTYYFLLLTLLLPFLANAQNWEAMGPDDFNQASLGDAKYPAMSTSSGIPYLAYVHNSTEIVVRKFITNKWQTVTKGFFSGNNPRHVKIVFDGTTPYVAYVDFNNEDRLTVKKHNGTDWEVVGTAGISGKNIQKIDFVFDGGFPYVAYTDGESNRKLVVKKYNGTSWVSVGSSDISGIYADYPSLVFDENHNPYVVYNDGNNSGKMTIKKYDSISSNWVAISDINLSNIESPRIAFNGGVLYALCRGWGNNNKLSVRKLNGTTWEPVATDISTEHLSGAEISFNGMIPYVMYKEDSNDHKTVVKKLNSNASGWETVGSLSSPQNSMGGGMLEVVPLVMSFLNSVPYIAYTEGDFEKKTLVKQFDGVDWQDLGESGITGASVNYLSLGTNGISPYIAYSDETKDRKLTVKKHDGANWETVGTQGFSVGSIDNINIAFDGTTPYVVYREESLDYDLFVDRYNGTSWERLTTSAISNGGAQDGYMAINNGTVYVTYTDFGNQGKVIVKKFNVNANAWEQVGGFISGNNSGSPKIAFDGSVPYVAFRDNYFKLTVKKFSNSTWEMVGNVDISATPSDLIINMGKIYIVYTNSNNNSEITVRNYDTATQKWELVGTPFAEQSSYDPKLIFVNDILHVAYSNYISGGANVRKFIGNNWEIVGNPDFSAGMPNSIGITSNGNELFVAYNAGDVYAKNFPLGTLPVKLVSFDADVKSDNQVRLSWKSASEKSNSYFTVSKSTDGKSFLQMATIKSQGENCGNYATVDFSPFNGTNYYKLSQTDKDGKTEELSIKTVRIQNLNTEDLGIYPNPTADFANVKFVAGTFTSATLLDLTGKMLAQQVLNAEQSEAQFDLSTYTTGTYLIRLVSAKESRSYKIVKL